MNLTGIRVGSLTILEQAESKKVGKEIRPFWNTICDCGKKTIVAQSSLKRSIKLKQHRLCKFCSAKKAAQKAKEKLQKPNRTHPLYKKYYDMKTRCRRDKKYKNINISSEWNTFDKFYNWAINNGWKDGLEIDRINPNKDYEPNNCRFVDKFLQAQNKRNYHLNPLGNIKKDHNKFVLRVQINHKRKSYRFDTVEEAIQKREELKNRKEWYKTK